MNWIRKTAFLLPTVSTGLVRVLQLAIMLVLANRGSDTDRDLLVAGFGLLTSFAMMTDSGAGNFLLSSPLGRITRNVYARAVGFHLTLATVGAVAALIFIAWPAGGYIPPTVLALLLALAVTQTVDSTGRIIRIPAMVAKKDAAYALPDVILFLLKLPIIVGAFLSADVRMLLLLPLPSLVVAAAALWIRFRSLSRAHLREPRLTRRILEFGVTGALSAFYSQSPLLIAAAILPLSQIATLTIVYRLIQALDLLPGTLSLQMIPRVRERGTSPWAYWALFFAGGATVALCVILAKPLIELLFGQQFDDVLVFIFVALSFAPKSGNYALVAFLMGVGRIRSRFVLTLIACLASVILSLMVVHSTGATGLASVTLFVEMAFTGGVWILLRRWPVSAEAHSMAGARP